MCGDPVRAELVDEGMEGLLVGVVEEPGGVFGVGAAVVVDRLR
ncbi:hypothetical protein [Micromonospora sp. KC606]|nr:hypothetical protein [Micromonospora sp. KC606]